MSFFIQVFIEGIALGAVYSLVALGFVIIFKATDVLSFAQPALAAFGAGIGLGQVGSAGLAVISENPALQSKVFIFVGMVESIAIYGIVMMFIILGQ